MHALTPSPPYYAVIFTTTVTDDLEGYGDTAEAMEALAHDQDGFLGIESVRDGALGITVSYWRDEGAIAAWKANLDHAMARTLGRQRWYRSYGLRVAKVERFYDWQR